MGRLILVLGANNSGKSLYAEALTVRCAARRCYVATMDPQTEDNHRRIARHRRQRQGLGFQTLELPVQVGCAPVPPDSAVLLEDVSNLLSNVLFAQGGSCGQVFRDLCALQRRCAVLVAVSIHGLDPAAYQGETAVYLRALNSLNRRLAAQAQTVILMRDRVPTLLKGELPYVE